MTVEFICQDESCRGELYEQDYDYPTEVWADCTECERMWVFENFTDPKTAESVSEHIWSMY